jgi:hypothetical protein
VFFVIVTKNEKMKKTILTFCAVTLAITSFAQANFTDLSPDEVVNATYAGESYVVDLDGDATPELSIFGLKKDTTYSGFAITMTGIAINTLGNTEIIGRQEALGGETVLVADTLNSGFTIDGNATYVNSSSPAIFPGVGLGAQDNFGFASIGQFTDAGMKYFGVKFEISGVVHYGWVRVSVSAASDVGTIESYGYEATAGNASMAGQQGSVFASVAENFNDLKVYTYDNNLYVKDTENGKVEIFNVIGNKMTTFSSNGNSVISIEDYPTGIYLVNYTKGNTTKTFKVIK